MLPCRIALRSSNAASRRPALGIAIASSVLATALWTMTGCEPAPDQAAQGTTPPPAAIAAEDDPGAAANPAGAAGETPPTAATPDDQLVAKTTAEPQDEAEPEPTAEPAAAGGDAVADAGAEADETAEPTPESKAVPGAKTVLILGDSLAATGFGVLLQKKLDAHAKIVAYRKGKSASGLARPDYFDWMGEAKKQIDLRNPDVVVVIMGGNDGQDLTPHKGKGDKRVNWQTAGWPDAYKGRMRDFLGAIHVPGRQVIWLGLPKMGLNSLEKKLVLIRDLQQSAVTELGEEGVYLETTPFLVDDKGALKREARIGGRDQRIREDDGVHFTMAGSQYLADAVYLEILKAVGLDADKAG
jgi:hypothetical protein